MSDRVKTWTRAVQAGHPDAERNLLIALADDIARVVQRVSDLEVRVNELLNMKVLLRGG